MNKKIWQLWKDFSRQQPEPFRVRAPKFVLTPDSNPQFRNSLLVIGLNPSFVEDRHCLLEAFHRWMDQNLNGLTYPEGFSWNGSGLAAAETFEEVEAIAENMARVHHEVRLYYPKHFGRLNRIATQLGIDIDNYAYADLYLWLTADSMEIKELRHDHPDLAKAQEEIFFDLLNSLRPKMILFAYKGAWHDFLRLCRREQTITTQTKSTLTGKAGELAVDWLNFPWCSNGPVPVCAAQGGTIPQGRGQLSKEDFESILNRLEQTWSNLHQTNE